MRRHREGWEGLQVQGELYSPCKDRAHDATEVSGGRTEEKVALTSLKLFFNYLCMYVEGSVTGQNQCKSKCCGFILQTVPLPAGRSAFLLTLPSSWSCSEEEVQGCACALDHQPAPAAFLPLPHVLPITPNSQKPWNHC